MNEERDRSIELVVAQAVSDVSEWGIGRYLGEPRLNDDNSEDGMFDVEFPASQPPAAMEVTAIVDGGFVSTADAAQRIVDEGLRAVAEESDLGIHWFFDVVSEARLRQLHPFLEDRIRRGDTSEVNLPPGLLSLGAEDREGPGVTIVTWSGTSAGPLMGISEDLVDALEANKAKLGAAGGYERHLAVDVQALRASDPGTSPAPDLPCEIDVLWVVRRGYSAMRGSPVVWMTDGSGGWKVNGEPHEAM